MYNKGEDVTVFKSTQQRRPLMLEKLKKFKWGYVILFLILAAVGTLCIVFPETLKIVCIASGIILSLYAAILFTITLARRELRSMKIL